MMVSRDQRSFGLLLILAISGATSCDAVPVSQLIPELLYCSPSDDPDPGCINDEIKSNLTGGGHILIVPGIAGISPLSLDDDLHNHIESDLLDLPVDCIVSPLSCGWSAQVWDWTDADDARDVPLEERVFVNQGTRGAAAKLSRRLRAWHFRNSGKRITLLCGSGGALVAVLAAEAIDAQGLPILPPDFMFDRIVFVSAALPTSRSLATLHARTRNGIFNYYSYNDGMLLGHFCTPTNFFFLLPFPIRIDKTVFDYPWPAAGRFGYRATDDNYQFITAQLAWNQAAGPPRNNLGGHMDAYRVEYFREFILPVLTGNAPPAGWTGHIADGYEQDVHAITCAESCASANVLPIPNAASGALVLFVPGIEGESREGNAADAIENELGFDTFVWDWTRMDDVRPISKDDRAELLPAIGARLATAINTWQGNNTADLCVLASSEGALVTMLACETRGGEQQPLLRDGTFTRAVMTSAPHSVYRPLTDLARCTQGGIFNYFSLKNEYVVGDFKCQDLVEVSNTDEAVREIFTSIGPLSTRWPAAGRFGYGTRIGPNFELIEAQLGWHEDFEKVGNNGGHLDELDEPFFSDHFVDIFRLPPPAIPGAWIKSLAENYDDIHDTNEIELDFGAHLSDLIFAFLGIFF